jgi:hypothetical protein
MMLPAMIPVLLIPPPFSPILDAHVILKPLASVVTKKGMATILASEPPG